MITLLLTIALLGFIVYLIITYIPMPAIFRNVLIVLAVIIVILYVMRVLGIADIPLP
jgi:hypothetical protein